LRTRQKTIHYIILTFFRHISRQLIGYKHWRLSVKLWKQNT
jgi:hypothetical protein